MEKDMKKYLGKVALRTFSLLLSVLVLLFCIFLLSFPKVASDMFGKMGMDKASAGFSKVVYERSGDFNDLATLFDRSVSGENYQYLYKYGEVLIEDKNLDDYAEFRRANYVQAHYKDYVYGNMAIGMFEEKDQQKSIAFVKSKTTENYYVSCALSIYSTHLATNVKTKEIEVVYDELLGIYENMYQQMTSNQQDTKLLCADAYAVSSKYNDESAKTLWKSRYN